MAKCERGAIVQNGKSTHTVQSSLVASHHALPVLILRLVGALLDARGAKDLLGVALSLGTGVRVCTVSY